MSVHIMLDLETLGRKPGCVILSIGAVAFDPHGQELPEIPFDSFHLGVTIKSCYEAGLKIEIETLEWWLTQGEAVNELSKLPKHGLITALHKFVTWWTTVKGDYVWGNSATFDPPIISAAFEAVGVERPWHFAAVRDCSTIYHTAYGEQRHAVPFPDGGVKHNALHDAWRQAVAVQRAVRKLGGSQL